MNKKKYKFTVVDSTSKVDFETELEVLVDYLQSSSEVEDIQFSTIQPSGAAVVHYMALVQYSLKRK